MDCSPWGHEESDTTERLHFLFFYHAGEVKTYAGDIRDAGSIPGSGRSPEEGTATHSSINAWKIPWTKEPGGL